MPSVARELPLDQPLYSKAELIERRRNIFCAMSARAPNEITIGKLS
jgi:hypothetical protein